MKHFVWYNSSGAFRGAELRVGGWDTEHDFVNDPTSTEVVQSIYEVRSKHPEFVGYYQFDCQCPSGPLCGCTRNFINNKRLVDGNVVDKFTYEVYLDSVLIPNTTQRPSVDKPANSTVALVLRGDLPDGSTIAIQPAKGFVEMLQNNNHILTFTHGSTDVANLSIPPRGMTGFIRFAPENAALACVKSLKIRGW